jgi:hypothetical protein
MSSDLVLKMHSATISNKMLLRSAAAENGKDVADFG